MNKHKTEIAALCLLLGVLCYGLYDYSPKEHEESFTLNNKFMLVRNITNKENITFEMLSLSTEDLLRAEEFNQKEESKEREEEKEPSLETEIKEEEIIVEEEEQISETYDSSYYEEPYYEETYYIPPYNEYLSSQIVNYALQFVGNPYVYGGNSLTNGTDCSGFTMLVYGTFGIYLPRSAPTQSYSGVSVGLDNIMPGDLVFSGYDGQICHVSIYIGNGQLVHALNENVGIVVTNLYIMPIIDVRRVI